MLIFAAINSQRNQKELIQNLDSRVADLRAQAFARTTAKTYSTHLKTYLHFCNLVNISPIPISQLNLARYIAYLTSRLTYTSLKQYLNIVRLLHFEAGLPNPVKSSWLIESLLRGCKRSLGGLTRPKLPITLPILQQIFQTLDLSSPFHIVFWAACLIAFFSFLRKSNLFCGHSSHPNAFLRRKDVTFLKQGATLHIRHSKTIQYGDRVLLIPIPHIPRSYLCPTTTLLLAYKSVAAPPDAPLLSYPTPGGPKTLSYQTFISRLKAVLTHLGFDASEYAGHSFRRGGASLALSCNLPADLIKLQGDWRSDCYQRYLEPDLSTKFSVANAMAAKVQGFPV